MGNPLLVAGALHHRSRFAGLSCAADPGCRQLLWSDLLQQTLSEGRLTMRSSSLLGVVLCVGALMVSAQGAAVNSPPDTSGAVPPLLLIPLVENAFKHGISETRNQPFVDIHLSVRQRQLAFFVKNSTEDFVAE